MSKLDLFKWNDIKQLSEKPRGNVKCDTFERSKKFILSFIHKFPKCPIIPMLLRQGLSILQTQTFVKKNTAISVNEDISVIALDLLLFVSVSTIYDHLVCRQNVSSVISQEWALSFSQSLAPRQLYHPSFPLQRYDQV